MPNNKFPLNRYKHCHNVGLRMYSYAKDILGWDEIKCQEMFMLGVTHDLSYELESDMYAHDELGAMLLDGYKYANEIRYHSFIQNQYISPELLLLYFADATIDGAGNRVTFKQRDDDLVKRYGPNHIVVQQHREIVNILIMNGFDDRI